MAFPNLVVKNKVLTQSSIEAIDQEEKIIVPSGIVLIERGCFSQNSNLKECVIEEGVQGIGTAAFYECISLQRITLPPSLIIIEGLAFQNCRNLNSVSIPVNTTWIGRGAFISCHSLKSIEIPDRITVINDGTFYDCTALESITLPSGITEIGECAFNNCKKLTSINIPQLVRSIKSETFANCIQLTSISLYDNIKVVAEDAFLNCNALGKVNIFAADEAEFERVRNLLPKAIQSKAIFVEKFANDGLRNYPHGIISPTVLLFGYLSSDEDKEVTIPDFIQSIGSGALSKIKMTSVHISEQVYSINQLAFFKCSELNSLTMPPSVSFIGNGAFTRCIRLETVKLSDNIFFIGEGAFSQCSALTSIKLPNKLLKIIRESFSGCTSLTSIRIPSSVVLIEDYAFGLCTALKTIDISESIISISETAFEECLAIETINIYASNEVEFLRVKELLPVALQDKALFIDNSIYDRQKKRILATLFEQIDINPIGMTFKKDLHIADATVSTPELNLLPNELWVKINEFVGKDFIFYKQAQEEMDFLIIPTGNEEELVNEFITKCEYIVQKYTDLARKLKYRDEESITNSNRFFPSYATASSDLLVDEQKESENKIHP